MKKFHLVVLGVMINLLFMTNVYCQMRNNAATTAMTQPAVIARVGDTPITHDEVYRRLFAIGGREVLNQIINEVLLDKEVERLKISVGDKDIEEQLSNIKAQFQDEKSFQESLKNSGINLDILKERLKQSTAREKLIIQTKNISVSKKEIEDFFNANKDRLGTPESIKLRRIVFKTKKDADDALFSINIGADFAKLAESKSEDLSTRQTGGLMGYITRGMLTKEIEDIVFAIPQGGVSEVIETNMGFIIFKVDEKRAASPAILNEKMRQDIKTALMNQKIQQALPSYLEELKTKYKVEMY